MQSDNDIGQIVEAYRATDRNDGPIELELRLGCLDSAGKFCPGVAKDVFESLLGDMQNTDLKADKQWQETVDYHYVCPQGRNIRTSVVFDSTNMVMTTTHIQKVLLKRLMAYRNCGGDVRQTCRVCLAREVPVLQPPGCVVPTHVRIKQRKRFQDVRDGKTVWSYELSKTWSANSRSAVERKQHTCEAVYEVECEL